MTNPFDPFKIHHELGRLYEATEIARIVRSTSIADRLGTFALSDALKGSTVRGYPSSKLVDLIGAMQRPFAGGELDRIRSLTATIGRLTSDVAALSNNSMFRVSEILKSISGPSMTLTRQLDAMFGIDRDLSRLFPTAHLGWKADIERSTMPWLQAHKAILPYDAAVLRMIDKRNFGIASWLSDESAPEGDAVETPPHFDLGALLGGEAHHAPESTPLDIKVHVRCYLCKEPIFGADSAVSWLGPKDLDLTIDVVPFCSECSGREADEPGFVAARLREMLGEPAEAVEPERLQLSISSGDDTDPVPRGELRLVPARDDNDDE